MAEEDLARKFVSASRSSYALGEAFEASMRAMQSSGCNSIEQFLLSLKARSNYTISALIVIHNIDMHSYPPLYGVQQWGEDGILLVWGSLEEEEKIASCMQAVGSLCRTSVRELQLGGLGGTSGELLPHLFKGLWSDNEDDEAASVHFSLECLRLCDITGPDITRGASGSTSNKNAFNIPFPRSLRFLRIEHSDFRVPSLLSCPDFKIQGLVLGNSNEGVLRDVACALSTTRTNGSLKALRCVRNLRPKRVLPEEFATEMLKENTTLTTLHLHFFGMPGPYGFDTFFESLVANKSLTQLSLEDCTGAWTLESVLDSLQENGSLSDIEFSGTPLEVRRATIEAQLERNKKKAGAVKRLAAPSRQRLPARAVRGAAIEAQLELAVLEAPSFGRHLLPPSEKAARQVRRKVPKSEEAAREVRPSGARLFLCGDSYAGKTTIVRSMTKMAECTARRILDKEWLLYNQMGKVRPRTKGIEVTPLSKEEVKVSFWDVAGQAEYHSFHDFLFPDLSNRESPSFFLFVWNPIDTKKSNSSGRKTGQEFCNGFEYWLKFITSKTRRSKVFIPNLIIALTRKDQCPDIKSQLTTEITGMKNKFQELIKFDIDSVFEVDSRKPSSVNDLAQKIFSTAEIVLDSVKRVFEVEAYQQVRSFFEKNLTARMVAPLITRGKYLEMCREKLHIQDDDVLENVALLLHESGDFIYLQSANSVVVNTHWFCHTIMGSLIHYTGPTNAIQANQGPGFFEKEYLQRLLEEEQAPTSINGKWLQCCQKGRTIAIEVTGDQLLSLLLELQLVCQDYSSPKVFMPSSLQPQSTSDLIQPSTQGNQVQLGRRLKCRDSDHTFLTAGVFPVLQVAFHNKFPERAHLYKDLVVIDHETGVHTQIQFCKDEGEDHFIDILACSPTSFEQTLEWVKRNVIKVILDQCASAKGVQGAELVQEVVRPSDVTKPLSSEGQPRRQVVPLEKLHRQIEEQLITQTEIFDTYIGGIYSWPPAEKISDLIGHKEVLEVCQRYQKSLREAFTVLGEDLNIPENPDEEEEEEQNDRSTASGNEIASSLKTIIDKLDYLSGRIGDISKVLHEVQKKVAEIRKGISDLHGTVTNKLTKLQSFLRQTEERRLPSMFVLTIDKGHNWRRVLAMVVPGLHGAYLQLLCEHKGEPHLPEGQRGIEFSTVDEDSFLKEAQPYMNYFLKFAYVAAKVGAHLATGTGSLIPDFSKVIGLLESSPTSTPSLTQREGSKYITSDFQARAHGWLWRVLEEKQWHTPNQIHNIFKLQPVRYEDDHQVAWLCDRHYNEGIQSKKLKRIMLN